MSVLNLFSKRQKRLRGEVPDVYTYKELPTKLRVQIVHIVREVLGDDREYNDRFEGKQVRDVYNFIVEGLCREFGVFHLNDDIYEGVQQQFFNFILSAAEIERVMDAIELSFKAINHVSRDFNYRHLAAASENADGAINELNMRFQENGVGYRFENDSIIRVDNEFVHAEIVKPALALLHQKEFSGAEAEFLSAHEHYRHGKHKEALTDCLKALESTMKTIAGKRKWQHDAKATAKDLLDLMFREGLIPPFWAQQFGGLRAILENGVPTARNRVGGHGQGSEIVTVPAEIVTFVLHQTAAAIVFLVSAEKANLYERA